MNTLDHVLNAQDHQALESTLLGDEFPWFYNSYKVDPSDSSPWDFQFTHTFYSAYAPSSPHMELLTPLLSILQPRAIVRIKANLTTRTHDTHSFNYHTDCGEFAGKTAVYYVNQNNGYTEFCSGQRVLSVANRLVSFDSQLEHRGTTCTDAKVRCVININYYDK